MYNLAGSVEFFDLSRWFFLILYIAIQQRATGLSCYVCNAGTDGCGVKFSSTGSGAWTVSSSNYVACQVCHLLALAYQRNILLFFYRKLFMIVMGESMETLPLFGKNFPEQCHTVETMEGRWKTFLVIKLDSLSSGKIRALEPFLGTCHFVVKSCKNMYLTSQPLHELCFQCNITSWQINWTLWEASAIKKK
jgi:hypothetical protein